jgi:hypothetical protein
MITLFIVIGTSATMLSSFVYKGFRPDALHSYQHNHVGIKRVGGPLDFVPKWPKMELSPPIRFRIEWACGQGNRHRFLVSGPF